MQLNYIICAWIGPLECSRVNNRMGGSRGCQVQGLETPWISSLLTLGFKSLLIVLIPKCFWNPICTSHYIQYFETIKYERGCDNLLSCEVILLGDHHVSQMSSFFSTHVLKHICITHESQSLCWLYFIFHTKGLYFVKFS